jgi:hypothetical protein
MYRWFVILDCQYGLLRPFDRERLHLLAQRDSAK